MESNEKRTSEPLFNVPPVTLGLFLVLLVIHLARLALPAFDAWTVTYWTLVPATFSETPWTLLTYALLHFGWFHFFLNATGLLAFGTGIERYDGRGWLIVLLIGGILCGAAIFLVLFPNDNIPLGGASAGISALFGAMLPLIAQDGRTLNAGIIVFVISNILFGMTGLAGEPGVSIAWQAHLSGFAFGLLMSFVIAKTQKNPGH